MNGPSGAFGPGHETGGPILTDRLLPVRSVNGCGPCGHDRVRVAGQAGTAGADRSVEARDHGRQVQSWPLLVLAMPAAVAVWSGWVGIGQMTGFGQIHPLPGIWNSLHVNTAVTLPIGVEAYAAYALRAWLATGLSWGRDPRSCTWSAPTHAPGAGKDGPRTC